MRMCFFIFFGFLKFNFVALTNDLGKRDALALIEVVSFFDSFLRDKKDTSG